jgi:hypothetical protein
MKWLCNNRIVKAVRSIELPPPEKDAPVAFSEGFENRMDAYFRSRRRIRYAGTGLRWVAAAAAAALAVMVGVNWESWLGGIALSPGEDIEPREVACLVDLFDEPIETIVFFPVFDSDGYIVSKHSENELAVSQHVIITRSVLTTEIEIRRCRCAQCEEIWQGIDEMSPHLEEEIIFRRIAELEERYEVLRRDEVAAPAPVG